MQIFGYKFNHNYAISVGVAGVIVGGAAGVSYLLYTFYKKPERDNTIITDVKGFEDLDLPIELAHDYGNYRLICHKADPIASAYLDQIPEEFFNFNQKLYLLASSHFTKRFTKFNNALVIGSGTGKLCIELSKIFNEVAGVERSFSKVVTCFRFQNRSQNTYHFPLEGSYRTTKNTIKIEEPSQSSNQNRQKRKRTFLENINFLDAEPNRELSLNDNFQLVILPNSLNKLDDPEGCLAKLCGLVVYDGILIIASDYSWNRSTNKFEGFGDFPVKTSFDYIDLILQNHFALIEETYIPDVIGESLRSCRIRNCHVSVWTRNKNPSSTQ